MTYHIIKVEPWGYPLAIFDNPKTAKEVLERDTGLTLDILDGKNTNGTAHHLENEKTGEVFFAICMFENGDFITLIHECSHMVDFMHEYAGVPCMYENTELRAYQVSRLVKDVALLLGFELPKKLKKKGKK